MRRRSVIAAALGSMVLLGGCGLRLDRRASDLPRLPLQGPHPSAALLQAELAACQAAEAAARVAAAAGGPALATTLVAVHRTQIESLSARLRHIGHPPTAGSTATTMPPGPAAGGAAHRDREATRALRLAEAVDTAPAQLLALAAADAQDVPVLAGCRAARLAAATLLGAPPPDRQPPSTPPTRPVGQHLFDGTDALVYGLQVAAARVGAADAIAARNSLQWASELRLRLQVSAGATAPVPPMGYRLPFPVHSAAAVPRLARHVLTRFADSVITVSTQVPLPDAADAARVTARAEILADLVVMAATAQVHRVRWGGDVSALPTTAPPAPEK